MQPFIGMAGIGLAIACSGAAAADPVVVLELYTSQGCSACPPADALLHELSQQDGVMAFSFHVNYWDYIGWADTFASRDNGQRQKTYAHGFGERMVYTPEMVVQGQAAVVGHKAAKIKALIDKVRDLPPAAEVEAVRDGDMIRVTLLPAEAPDDEAEVYVIRFLPQATVQIGRGENAGREVTYSNVVMDWHLAEIWSGKDRQELSLPVTGDLPVAVLVQERGQGPVLAAALAR